MSTEDPRAFGRAASRRELARALLGACAAPWKTAGFLLEHDSERAQGLVDLEDFVPPVEVAPLPEPPERPLRILVSAAESSGEMHAKSAVLALRRLLERAGAPAPEIHAIGGRRLRELGIPILADPVERAAMGFSGIAGSLAWYLRLIEDFGRALRELRPDAFLPVDSPALHVPMAHVARRAGVPVVHHVTPQYWGWAPWRVEGYRRAVDRALTILPFEPAWFRRHGVDARHVGHPLLDLLPPRAGGPSAATTDRRLVLLPGSRSGVVELNLPWMLAAAARLRERLGEIEVVVAQEDERHATAIRAWIERSQSPARLLCGDLHETLAGARAALSVSGTVLIDLLHQRLPTIVVYRVRRRREVWMARNLLTLPWFAAPNLLCGRMVYPEHCFRGDGPPELIEELERAFVDEEWRAGCRAQLERAAKRLGPPGASERAARQLLEVACAEARGSARPWARPRS